MFKKLILSALDKSRLLFYYFISWIIIFFLISIFFITDYIKIYRILFIFDFVYMFIELFLMSKYMVKKAEIKIVYSLLSLTFLIFRIQSFVSITMDLLLYKLLIFSVIDSISIGSLLTLFILFKKRIIEKKPIKEENLLSKIEDAEIRLEIWSYPKFLERIFESNVWIYKIKDIKNNKTIGWIEYRFPTSEYWDNMLGQVGYEIKRKYRGSNYARKATILLFEILKNAEIEKVIITAFKDNQASIKILDSLPWVSKNESLMANGLDIWNKKEYIRYEYLI